MRWLMEGLRAWALLAPLLFVMGGAGVQAAQPRAERAPEAVVKEFYVWYLDEMAKDHTPLQDQPKQMAGFVSPALLKEIDAKMRGKDGMEADYFIRAQDYIDDWLKHIAVAPAKVSGNSATTSVVLGSANAAAGAKQRLSVMLTKDKEGWRIRKVSSLEP